MVLVRTSFHLSNSVRTSLGEMLQRGQGLSLVVPSELSPLAINCSSPTILPSARRAGCVAPFRRLLSSLNNSTSLGFYRYKKLREESFAVVAWRSALFFLQRSAIHSTTTENRKP